MEELWNVFPIWFRKKYESIKQFGQALEEIQIRVNRCIIFIVNNKEYYVNRNKQICDVEDTKMILDVDQVKEIFCHICEYSPYAFQGELEQGFISIAGGHRIGVAGEMLIEQGKIISMKYVRFLHIRIAHERRNVANDVFKRLLCGDKMCSTLILSPPGHGKTTLLRDIVRLFSDGTEYFEGKTVAIIDERGEIAGSYKGIPQLEIGKRSYVYDGCPKTEGMLMALRALAPKLIAVDEIGGEKDLEAIKHIMRCGCSIVATIHADHFDSLKTKKGYEELIYNGLFQRYVEISKMEKRLYIVFDEKGKRVCFD